MPPGPSNPPSAALYLLTREWFDSRLSRSATSLKKSTMCLVMSIGMEPRRRLRILLLAERFPGRVWMRLRLFDRRLILLESRVWSKRSDERGGKILIATISNPSSTQIKSDELRGDVFRGWSTKSACLCVAARFSSSGVFVHNVFLFLVAFMAHTHGENRFYSWPIRVDFRLDCSPSTVPNACASHSVTVASRAIQHWNPRIGSWKAK